MLKASLTNRLPSGKGFLGKIFLFAWSKAEEEQFNMMCVFGWVVLKQKDHDFSSGLQVASTTINRRF